ncbi:hypothetical protein ABZ490_21500 [Streptomyces sp. NPDC005811]|uniref:hypothetical protein n=1 Tax=Streptomyces sp. NPDC005811 TaxID=3154565 RepID=UPI0033C75105
MASGVIGSAFDALSVAGGPPVRVPVPMSLVVRTRAPPTRTAAFGLAVAPTCSWPPGRPRAR